MENIKKINFVNEYWKNKFGERTLKICIDGNFTCPNRDGKCGVGGCIFCGSHGAGEHLKTLDYTGVRNFDIQTISNYISNQVNEYFSSYRAKRANKFIVYFQNFTNTYDSVENLKIKYDSALINEKIIGISIATRPDCINEEIVKLLNSYAKKYYVCVELGLQTADENIGKLINRGYNNQTFTEAVTLLNKYNIDVIAHLMVGLPGENNDSIEKTVSFINSHSIHGLKIHSTYIIENTKLAELYYKNEYSPITLDYYIKTLSYILTHINPEVVIHRISGDAPKDLLISPEWNLHKKWILNGTQKYLKENHLWQGKFFK